MTPSLIEQIETISDIYNYRYWGYGSINFFLGFSSIYCLMFARFIYVRYAEGLVQQGVRMFNFLVVVIIASLCGYYQSGALSLVGRIEIVLSLVESFIELKYFHDVATPALLCHKEPARRIGGYCACSSLVLYGIRDRWLPCTERSYYAIKNQRHHDLGPRVLHSAFSFIKKLI